MKSTISSIMDVRTRKAGAVLVTPPGVVKHRGRMSDVSTVSPDSRECTQCGETKLWNDFPKNKSSSTGYRNICKKCHSAKNARYNREVWLPENRDRQNDYLKSYYQAHKVELNQKSREYARAHPLIDRARQRRRRAEKAGSTLVSLTQVQWREQVEFFGNRCAYCLLELARDDQDHIVPLSQQGAHVIDNVVPVCQHCNAKKRDLSLLECLVKGYLP